MQDGLDLPSALRIASRNAQRRSEIHALWKVLPDAVLAYQALFQNAAYQARTESTKSAIAAMPRAYPDHPIVLLGAAAVGLAADNEVLEIGIYLDEDEALLRRLIDLGIPFQVGEQRAALRCGQPGRRCTTISHGLRGPSESLAVRLLCLPRSWQGKPIFLGELPWPMLNAFR